MQLSSLFPHHKNFYYDNFRADARSETVYPYRRWYLLTRLVIPKPCLKEGLEDRLPKWHVPHLVAHRILGKHAPGQDRLGPESTIPTIEMLLRFGWTAFESDAMVNLLCEAVRMVKNVQASSCLKIEPTRSSMLRSLSLGT